MTDRYALVVGISEYDAFTRLEKAAASALEVARMLKEHGSFRVEPAPVAEWADAETPKKMGGRLQGQDLWRLLETFFLETSKGSHALFYFCGHGFVLRDAYDRDRKEAFLTTSDTVVNLDSERKIISQQGGIAFRSLIRLLSQAELQSLVVILDCCHSGSLLEEPVVEQFLGSHNRDCPYRLIAACRAVESAYESAAKPQSYTVFTSALLDALTEQRADEEGRITDGRAWEIIERQTIGRLQKPVTISLRGSITLVQYPPRNQLPGSQNHLGSLVRRENPYIGLYAFEEKDELRFFGREKASWDLLEDLRDNRFLAVVGDSGSGKSSLVKAGLLPKLRQGKGIPGSDQWQIESMRPGTNPAVRLRAILAQAAGNQPRLVFIDQFEEVFTLCTDELEKTAFMQQITQEVKRPGSQIRFLITIRGDFLTRCSGYDIADLINASKPRGYIVKAMTEDELRHAIAKPASLQGVKFEPHLVDQMIQEIHGQAGALPLLQHALQRLWQECIETPESPESKLTWQAYEQIGGLAGALNQEADAIYNSLTSAEQEFARHLFGHHLVQREGNIFTRRRLRQSRLEKVAPSSAMLERVLDLFTDKRLLVRGIVESAAQDNQEPPEVFVEIAHEAILEQWTLLKTWLQEDQEKLDLLQQLRTSYDNWNTRYSQQDNALLMGALLANVEEKLDWRSLPEEADYVRKSLDRRDREVRFYRLTTAGAIAAAVCITGISILGALQWRAADREQIRAQTNFARASFTVNRDQFDALLEALKAGKRLQQSIWFRNDPELRAEVMEALEQTTNWVREENRLEGHNNFVWAVSFSPDGQTLATGGWDNTLRLWSANGEEKQVLKDHTDAVTGVSFSRDGQFLVTCSKDGTIKIRDRNGQVLKPLQGRGIPLWRVRFSPDGSTVAAVSEDGYITLWEWQTDLKPKVWKGHPRTIYDIDFSPDGQAIATAGDEGSIKLWTRQGQLKRILTGHTQAVTALQFSPVGSTLASGSKDRTAVLWNWKTGIKQRTLTGNQGTLNAVQFSGDGQHLATAGDDAVISLWSQDGTRMTTLKRHQERVTSLSFSPDGQHLASASVDGTIKLWQVQPHIRVLQGYADSVYIISFKSPDGKLFATDGEQNSIKLWRTDGTLQETWKEANPIYSIDFSPKENIIAATSGQRVNLRNFQGQLVRPLAEHQGPVLGVSFSPDGQMLATSGADSLAKLWTVSGQQVGVLKGHTKAVHSVLFSPDGQTIATASWDGTVKLWNPKGQLQHSLQASESQVYRVSFSPDNSVVAAVGQSPLVKLWRLDGTPLPDLKGHTKAVMDVSFSPNGQFIATVSNDGSIKLWTRDSQLFMTLLQQEQPVNAIRFSPDNKWLVAGTGDKTVLLIDVDNLSVGGLMQRGCHQIQHYKAAASLCQN